MPENDKFLNLQTYADISRLVEEGIDESLTLEYKASPALSRDRKQVEEMCKDVSSFANAAGGQLIYGIQEDRKTHKPTLEDPGILDVKITGEWIEQSINSNIHPRISGIQLFELWNDRGGRLFVLTIPASNSGPHQAPDKRYYKRFNLQSVAMEDYEIRDVLNRSVTPELFARPGFPGGPMHVLQFKAAPQKSLPVQMSFSVGNRSGAPAEYARFLIGIDADFIIEGHTFPAKMSRELEGTRYETFVATWSVLDKHLPIFRETNLTLTEKVMISVKEEHLVSTQFEMFIGIQAPGFSSLERFRIVCKSGNLEIVGPLPKS